MPRALVADLRSHLDGTVTVYGWVHTLRLQRRIQFVLVRDHTGLVQVTHLRGGFGLGLARLLMLALGLPSIREATFLFRGPHRLEP